MPDRKLLIISPHFAPSGLVGAKRPTRLAVSIREHGWQPFVLTFPESCCERLDPSSHVPSLEEMQITRVPCWSPWLHSRWWRRRSRPGLNRALGMLGRGLARLTDPVLPTGVYDPWKFLAIRAGVKLVREHGVDLIWSTSPPAIASEVAYGIGRRTNVPYVLDFRDVQLLGQDRSFPRQARNQFRREEAAVKQASGITYCAPVQIRELRSRYGASKETPCCLAYNWLQGQRLTGHSVEAFERPTLLHGGALYFGSASVRPIDALFAGLARLRHIHYGASKDLQFVHFDSAMEASYIGRLAADHGVTDSVSIRPPVPSDEFLSYCRAADMLLVFVGRNTGQIDHAGAIPAKVYGYLSAKRPILVVGPEGCEAGRLVERVRRGRAAVDDDPESIAEAIAWLREASDDPTKLDFSDGAVQEFQEGNVVAKLADFFARVADGSGGDSSR